MNRFLYLILIVCNISLCFSQAHAQNTSFEKYLAESAPYEVKVPDGETLSKNQDNTELGAKDFIRDTGIYYTFIWAFRMFYVRNKNSRIFDTSLEDWWDNVSQWPVTNDGDSFFTNYVVHPFSGAMSFLYYREMGHDFWASFLGSVVQSTLFEYTIEGLVETPSLPDLLSTPTIGSLAGYGLEKTSDYLYETENGAARVAAHILNPMRNFVKDRRLVLFNPLKGQYEFTGEFQTKLPPAKEKSIQFGYPQFFEPAIPTGYFQMFVEVQELDRRLNSGEFILYHIKAEFPSANNFYSAYLRVSQAGVNSVKVDGNEVRDGFELANLLIGGKSIFYKTDSSVFTLGIDVILPLAYKDNIDRLETIVQNSPRDYPLYLQRAFTFTPYLSTLHYYKGFSLQNNIGFDFITRAEEYEGNAVEYRFKYNSAAGYYLPVEFLNPILFTEFNGITQFSADTFDKTDLFLSGGIRLGKRFSPGFSVQVPVKGSSNDNVDYSYVIDLKIRF